MDIREPAPGAQDWQQAWLDAFGRFALRRPDRAAEAARFAEFVARRPDAAERALAEGHLTGSAWSAPTGGACC